MDDSYPLHSSRPRHFLSSDSENETDVKNGLSSEQLKALEENSDEPSHDERSSYGEERVPDWEDATDESDTLQIGSIRYVQSGRERVRRRPRRSERHPDRVSAQRQKATETASASWVLAKRTRTEHERRAKSSSVISSRDGENSISAGPAGEVERLKRQLAEMKEELDVARGQKREASPAPASLGYRHTVLHAIGVENPQYYLDEPQWTVVDDFAPQLQASQGIRSPSQYLDNHPEIAFVFFRTYNPRPPADASKLMDRDGVFRAAKPDTETLELVSPKMVDALAEFVDLVPDFETMFPTFDPNEVMSAPYQLIYYCDSSLDNVTPSLEPLHATLVHQLFDAVRKSFGRQFALTAIKAEKGLVTKQLAPFLVKPGDILVMVNGPRTQAYEALSWLSSTGSRYTDDIIIINNRGNDVKKEVYRSGKHDSEPAKTESELSFSVSVTSFEFDGLFHKKEESLSVKFVSNYDDDEIEINKLNLYPLKYAPEKIKERLARRGKMLWDCHHRRLVNYLAETESHLEDASDRFMVDMTTFRKLNPKKLKKRPSPGYYSSAQMLDEQPPQMADMLTYPPIVYGYNLRIKTWRLLFVDYIVHVTWNKEAFEHLVAEEKTKILIKALVTNQLAANQTTDVIDAKGGGLVLLLHGGPGTGKTFTAEGVAEFAEKPLLRVTCGDAGIEASAVERYLQNVFRLGHLWDCVVLLDEADVFLEERDIRDLNRNALVSVFLRILEYYQGILILTSNRVGTFDEAFKSRIQLALHYENLTKAHRQKVWRNFLIRVRGLGESQIDFDDINDHIEELATPELNGREIRNVVTTARQLAKYEGEVLRYTHVRDALEVSAKFGTYLKTLFKKTDDQRQRSNQIRL